MGIQIFGGQIPLIPKPKLRLWDHFPYLFTIICLEKHPTNILLSKGWHDQPASLQPLIPQLSVCLGIPNCTWPSYKNAGGQMSNPMSQRNEHQVWFPQKMGPNSWFLHYLGHFDHMLVVSLKLRLNSVEQQTRPLWYSIFLALHKMLDKLIRCLEKVPNIFSQMVFFFMVIYHGRIRKTSPSSFAGWFIGILVMAYWVYNMIPYIK